MNKDTNATTTATNTIAGASAIATKTFEAKYNYKTVKPESDNHAELQKLVTDGLLKADEVEQVLGEDKKTIIGYKRKAAVVSFAVPDMAQALEGTVFTANQVAHLQFLVERAVDAANKRAVDTCDTNALTTWDVVLESSPTQRKASAVVTMDMINASVAEWLSYLQANTSTKAQGLDYIGKLATKKFSVSACNKVKLDVLERMQGLLIQWFDTLSVSEQIEHSPVLNLWASELEKTLNPQQEEISLDMFGE